MSWWVSLVDENEVPLKVSAFQAGGTYVAGGSTDAELNITYNYSKLFARHLHEDRLRWLHGKTGAETAQQLQVAVLTLSMEGGALHGTSRPDRDYWKPTHGNAAAALNILKTWALLHPHGVWRIS